LEILQRLKRDATTRNKLLITVAIMFAVLIGYRIPLPGINTEYLKLMNTLLGNSGIGGFIGMMTGGSMESMSIFALSITPYITASILLQLLSVVFPRLQEIQRDGSVGHQKMERLTYIIGAIVAIVESLGLAIGFGRQGLFVTYTWYMVLYATVVWTLGACFLMWIGQTITNKLIGNGTSLLLLFNILSTLPGDMINIYYSFAAEGSVLVKIVTVLAMIAVILLVLAYVVVLNNAEKKIRVSNSAKSGKWMAGATDNTLPLKLNMGGVMPIIFASSFMSFPVLIASFMKIEEGSITSTIIGCFSQGNWFRLSTPIYTLGVILFIPLVYAFAYFYSLISFNPKDIADNLRRNGSVVDGVRPGQPTADYLEKQAKSMLWLGTSMLLLIALLPTIISGLCNISGLSFGGTTITIIVSTILEMKNTINAQTSSVAYKSLIKRGGKHGGRSH
jgi:preprotein translocase subunit SecY